MCISARCPAAARRLTLVWPEGRYSDSMASRDGRTDLLTIGSFALASGLTVDALRHYHELGLLVPARVDDATGYRRYSLDQVRRAQAIRSLRSAQVPLNEIAALLDLDRPDLIRKALTAHRDRLEAEADELTASIDRLNQMIEKGRVMPLTTGPRVIGMTVMGPDVEALRSFYEATFGMEFEQEDHGDGVHYHATGGSFSYPDGLFLFSLWGYHDGWPQLRSGIEMYVDGVDATYERALANGAVSAFAPFDSDAFPRSAIFDDPAGNRVQIYESTSD
jgi:DNA-binding transcriptional MerR regulator